MNSAEIAWVTRQQIWWIGVYGLPNLILCCLFFFHLTKKQKKKKKRVRIGDVTFQTYVATRIYMSWEIEEARNHDTQS